MEKRSKGSVGSGAGVEVGNRNAEREREKMSALC